MAQRILDPGFRQDDVKSGAHLSAVLRELKRGGRVRRAGECAGHVVGQCTIATTARLYAESAYFPTARGKGGGLQVFVRRQCLSGIRNARKYS